MLQNRSTRGFTLIELLIGLTLLSFIMALLFGGFRLATRTWDAVEIRTEETARRQATISLLRRVLSSVQPLRFIRVHDQALAFIGEADRLMLVAPLSERTGLRSVELSFEPASGRFVLRDAPPPYSFDTLQNALANAEERILLDRLAEGRFTYYGIARPGEAPAWLDRWDYPDRLPKLIGISLSFGANDLPIELVAEVVADASRSARTRITSGGGR